MSVTHSHALPLAPGSSFDGFSTTQLLGAFAVSIAICAALMWDTGLSIDPLRLGNAGYLAVLAILLAIRFAAGAGTASRWAKAGADCAEYYALFTATALIGAVTSYPVAALSHGFIDGKLEGIDSALHFNWLAWYDLVAAHHVLQVLGVMAYQSIYVIPAVLLGAFALQGQRREAHQFIAGFWLAAIITLILFRFLPAEGPLSYLWKGPISYMPTSEVWQAQLLPALRSHRDSQIDLNQLQGLVSAPSFHTVSAVLYIAAAWRAGRVRWPLIGLSLAMLLSTPVEGTHYLADMLLGALVALVALAAVAMLMRNLAQAPGTAAVRSG